MPAQAMYAPGTKTIYVDPVRQVTHELAHYLAHLHLNFFGAGGNRPVTAAGISSLPPRKAAMVSAAVGEYNAELKASRANGGDWGKSYRETDYALRNPHEWFAEVAKGYLDPRIRDTMRRNFPATCKLIDEVISTEVPGIPPGKPTPNPLVGSSTHREGTSFLSPDGPANPQGGGDVLVSKEDHDKALGIWLKLHPPRTRDSENRKHWERRVE